MQSSKISLIPKEYKKFLEDLDIDNIGISILANKMETKLIYIENLHVGAANILKQEAISVGADLAVPKGTIIAKTPFVNALLIANKRAIQKLTQKLKIQPFGLKTLGVELLKLIKEYNFRTKVMGVININSDSFYNKSRTDIKNAIDKINQAIIDGADIIDIGAVSSRPNSDEVDEEEELNRLRVIVDEIYRLKLYEKTSFSIDTYSAKVAGYTLDRGFKIVNNIKGIDDKIAKIVSLNNAKTVIMHMQGTPKNMQDNPTYKNTILDIENFFNTKLEIAYKYNIEDVILDVGIGFGKTTQDNLTLIRNLSHFQKFGKEILIGASRKSIIDAISPSKVEDRLSGTLAIHLKAIENGASIVRCHDIKEHIQAIKVNEAINKI